MTTSIPETPAIPETSVQESGRRTGATWVAATGAAMILAAATVFVAVRWHQIPDLGKFAILLAITGSCFTGGLALRRTLSATGSVLVHLGALLVPVNLAAANLQLELDWRSLLLVEGLVTLAVFAGTARLVRSGVLTVAATGSGLAIAGGIGALSAIPAPFVVAVASGALVLAGRFASRAGRRFERHAIGAACASAIAPISVFAFELFTFRGEQIIGRGVAADLGVLDASAAWSLTTAALLAVVIGVGARRRDQVALVAFAAVGAATHGYAAWSSLDVDGAARWVSAASMFVLIELASLAARRDPFWRSISRRAAIAAEALSAPVVVTALGVALTRLGPNLEFGTDNTALPASAFGLLAIGYLLSGFHSVDIDRGAFAQWRTATDAWRDLPVAVCALAAIAISAPAERTVAIGALALGAIWFGSRRTASVFANGLMGYAVISVASRPYDALAVGAAAAAIGVFAAIDGRRRDRPDAQITALVAIALFGIGTLAVGSGIGVVDATTILVAGCLLLAFALDHVDPRIGNVARGTGAASILWLIVLPPSSVVIPSFVLIGAAIIDALCSRQPIRAAISAVPIAQLQFAAASALGLTLAESGLALIASAFVWLGVGMLVDGRWRQPVLAVGALSGALGVVLAMTTLATAGLALIGLGTVALAGGVLQRIEPLQHGAGIVITVGVWLVLGAQDVGVAEAFLAPIAAHLLISGIVLRQRAPRGEISSWLAYVPGIVMLVAPALLERFSGGSATHALFAGAIGAIAVAVGGWWRQLGTLFVGTLCVAIVTLHETFDAGVDVPTWVWLAAGGTSLLAAAVAMERRDASPVEAGRRIVDVLSSRFD
jgi:hypothetical protein